MYLNGCKEEFSCATIIWLKKFKAIVCKSTDHLLILTLILHYLHIISIYRYIHLRSMFNYRHETSNRYL